MVKKQDNIKLKLAKLEALSGMAPQVSKARDLVQPLRPMRRKKERQLRVKATNLVQQPIPETAPKPLVTALTKARDELLKRKIFHEQKVLKREVKKVKALELRKAIRKAKQAQESDSKSKNAPDLIKDMDLDEAYHYTWKKADPEGSDFNPNTPPSYAINRVLAHKLVQDCIKRVRGLLETHRVAVSQAEIGGGGKGGMKGGKGNSQGVEKGTGKGKGKEGGRGTTKSSTKQDNAHSNGSGSSSSSSSSSSSPDIPQPRAISRHNNNSGSSSSSGSGSGSGSSEGIELDSEDERELALMMEEEGHSTYNDDDDDDDELDLRQFSKKGKKGKKGQERKAKKPPKKRKNRMGQIARRRLAEQQFGKEAEHLKKGDASAFIISKKKRAAKQLKQLGPNDPVPMQELEQVEEALHPSWQAKKKASVAQFAGSKVVFDDDGDTTTTTTTTTTSNSNSNTTTTNTSAVRGNKRGASELEGNLHPSWLAKRAKKDEEGIVPFEGTKITFDDDSD